MGRNGNDLGRETEDLFFDAYPNFKIVVSPFADCIDEEKNYIEIKRASKSYLNPHHKIVARYINMTVKQLDLILKNDVLLAVHIFDSDIPNRFIFMNLKNHPRLKKPLKDTQKWIKFKVV